MLGVRGDRDDVFSHGFICPKGASLGELHADPDRLRTPLVRRRGELVEASWDEAFARVDELLAPILAAGDRDAIGAYLGNPNAHTLDGLIYLRAVIKAFGTRNVFTATSVDQLPKQLSSALMFGAGLSVAVPDLDRTDHILILGANPLVSNGSLMTAPDSRGRLRAIQERGGKVVVVDPRRSRTAEVADEHHFIRPGRDALLLAAIAHVLLAEGIADPGALADHLNGLDELGPALEPFAPEAVGNACGIEPAVIAAIARELASAERAVVYARIGTTTAQFGTLASWLVDVINALTGNLDREGGAMFPLAAAGQSNSSGEPGRGRGFTPGRWSSRVRGLGESFGELPVACLAEEIETAGPGRIRAMLTIAGNPLLSTPNAGRLRRAFESLEVIISVDAYVNETTEFADVVFPAPSPLARSHYDLALYQLAVRNVANFSPPMVDSEVEPEWRTFLRLAAIAAGQGPDADIDGIDRLVAFEAARRETVSAGSPAEGMDPAAVVAALGDRRGPERVLDLLLRCGPYGAGIGDAGGRGTEGLSLELLERNPHGIDLGPLRPRLPDLLRTASGRVELAPSQILADLPRLELAARERGDGDGAMVLIGRRQLRSNNSWMHNLPHLVRGKPRCTMQISPADAARLGLADGDAALVRSRTGALEAPVEVTDAIMDGVVSIPHGWGHDAAGARLGVAAANAGVNSNLLSDETLVDELSGNAVLNGVPVEVAPVLAPVPA